MSREEAFAKTNLEGGKNLKLLEKEKGYLIYSKKNLARVWLGCWGAKRPINIAVVKGGTLKVVQSA